MKRLIVLATGITLFCLVSLPVFAQRITPKPVGKDQWQIYDLGDNLLGSFTRTEKGNFKFYDSAGQYMGIIVGSREWLPRGARASYTRITREEAQLYLDVLEAIDKIPVESSPPSGRW